ncbi:pentapeptide repeat-containing protein [uncultured Dokdonia sp.]|uniref:pentapeptide repeat-containing protein n=1 Tax=uncultured Dokdonia sp. TaxID=575653 RepID=UPI0030EC3E64|tara:strand:+ start:14381 stop:15607 length:1227 start_codon:yes stop_codon:yes gene_type:complete
MERGETIESTNTVLVASSNTNTFHDTLFKSAIDVPYKPDLKDEMLIHDESLGGLPAVKGYNMSFNDCTFDENVNVSSDHNKNCVVTFVNCIFRKDVWGEDSVMDGKVRFRNCHFKGDVNFRNTTFNNLADFWSCTFYKPTTFYKTDFRDIVVFSAVNFKENVLFTYTLIEKLMILRGTDPEKGFDLSLAIIAGELSVFDFQFDDYSAYGKIYKDLSAELKQHHKNYSYQKAYETVYENAVSNEHLIPLENKRETYRILKSQLESQKNYIDAVPFRVMENKTLLKESVKKLANGHTFWRPISNIIVLVLNALSNWFGSSYLLGLVFTVSIASIFFNLALSHIGDFVFTWNYENWQWRYFVQFINPTHRTDYMKLVDENPRQWFFIWDFIGRIFIGYGIYQTIQAFRKYK